MSQNLGFSTACYDDNDYYLYGNGGNDTLIGGARNDFLDGGDGNDTLRGGAGNDMLVGGEDNDILSGGSGSNILQGGRGNDVYIIDDANADNVVIDVLDGWSSTIRFSSGVSSSQISSRSSSNDLILSVDGSLGEVTIKNYYLSPESWRFETASGFLILNDDVVNPLPPSQLKYDIEAALFREFTYAGLPLNTVGDDPVDGKVVITPVTGILENYVINEDLEVISQKLTGVGSYIRMEVDNVAAWSYRFDNDSLLKMENSSIVDEITGTDGTDWILPNPAYDYNFYYKDVYVSLGDITKRQDGTYLADITGSSYIRPDFIPAGELVSIGDNYQGILLAQVGVQSYQYRFSIIDAGAGNDVVGQDVPVIEGTIASTFHDGSVIGSNYYSGPMSVDGGTGDDVLFGGRQNDFLNGGDDNDFIFGRGGDDVLIGGQGHNYLYGHGGSDRYLVDFSGVSNDIVIDNGLFTENDVLGYLMEGRGMGYDQAVELLRSSDESLISELKIEFPGVFSDATDTVQMNADLSDVALSWVAADEDGRIGISITSLANPDASVVVKMRGPNDFLGFGIEKFQFNDVTLSQAEVTSLLPELPSVFPIVGTNQYDELYGMDDADILVGKGDYDDLYGGDGDDVYLYNAGDGGDYIGDLSEDTGLSGVDALSFGAGIRPEDIKASLQFLDFGGGELWSSLVLEIGDSPDDWIEIEWGNIWNNGSELVDSSMYIERTQFLNVNGGQVFDLLGIVAARQAELVDAYDQGVSISLFTPEVINNFDITATVGLLGGAYAYNYATTGDIYTAPSAVQIPTVTIGGASGNDLLSGTDGNDVFEGKSGNDTLNGGLGNDTFLYSGNSNGTDRVVGGDGTDTLLGSGGDDVISLAALSLADSIEVIDGGAGNDILAVGWGGTLDLSATTLVGIEQIAGSGGNDTLIGSAGDDLIVGNNGNDTLKGGLGNDTFIYSGNSNGTDRVVGGDGTDTLLGSGGDDVISLAALSVADSIEVIDGGAGNDILAVGWGGTLDLSTTTLVGIEQIAGSGGNDTLIGSAGDDLISGNGGNDTLKGGLGNDILDGGAANDSLIGGAGNDTYLFGRGYGVDTVTEDDVTVDNTDVAQFGSDIATDQLWFKHVGNNLEVSIIGTSDRMVMKDWYLGGQYHTEQFKTSDGSILLDTQVENLVSAMASFAPPAAGQTSLTPEYEASLVPVIAANWQ